MNRKETLMDLYHKQGLSQREIARRFGVGISTIVRWMRADQIPARDTAEAMSLSWARKSPASPVLTPKSGPKTNAIRGGF